jgi:tetratricopeptide (TPR) repeat protein
MNFCPFCGAQIKVKDKFCTSCGKEIPATVKKRVPFDQTVFTLFKKGENLHRQGKLKEAIECYNAALKINPNAKEILLKKQIALQLLERDNQYIRKKTHIRDFSIILSLIPKEERILFISERFSNKKLAISIRILVPVIVFWFIYFISYFPYNGFSFKLISINWISNPIVALMSDLVIFGVIIFVGYLIGKKYYNIRKDFYIILTDEKIFTLLFSIKYKFPVLKKYTLSKNQYFSIQKRLFRKSATLIFFNFFNIIIQKTKLKGIKDFEIIQEYLDSIFFHFGKSKDDWLYKAKYSIPLKLIISKGEFYKVKKRLKNIKKFFGISTPIVIFIGVFSTLFASGIFYRVFALIIYAIFALFFYGFSVILYFPVWYQLTRCSSLDEQMIVKSDEIEYNDITIPFSKKMMISAVYLSKWEHTQRTLRPLPNIYCIEINDDLTLNEKKFFGPIEDFQNCFKFIYSHLLEWKNKRGHLFSKEELYENEIKR